MDLDREIGRALDALADCDDITRVSRIIEVAELVEESERQGGEFAQADYVTALTYRMIADADLVATGQRSQRVLTDSPYEFLLGDTLDRMAAEPNLRRRAEYLTRIWDALLGVNDMAAESIACMPYGGLVGGRDDEMYYPSSFPKLVRNFWREWRKARAA